MTRPLLLLATLAALALAAAGCGEGSSEAVDLSDRKIRVVTTANFITDTVRQIGGERTEVTGLMGPGVDPHLYKASAGDVSALREADAIFYGGLDLEGRMADLLDALASDRTTVPIAEAVDEARLLETPDFEGGFDPHVWFDPTLWESAATEVATAFKRIDPANASGYDQRLTTFMEEVDRVDTACEEALEPIPERSRVLVTSHDAFSYFGERHDFDVEAIQGISTATEASTADIKRVADVLVQRDVKAVFVESSVPRQTIEAVIAAARQQGHEVTVGGELYADAAGEEGTPEGTYAGMVESNCRTIADGLS